MCGRGLFQPAHLDTTNAFTGPAGTIDELEKISDLLGAGRIVRDLARGDPLHQPRIRNHHGSPCRTFVLH